MIIREYCNTDRNKILDLLRLNTPEYFSPDEEKGLIHYFDNHIEQYFVVETDKVIVGCGGFNLSGNSGKIGLSWDIVHPQYQGKGAGRTLVGYRIDRIKELDGISIIGVRTSQLVYKFYEKLGFELKQIVKDYWAAGYDLYDMERAVN